MRQQHRTLTAEIGAHVGAPVCIRGWAHRVRELSAVTFLIVRDRAGLAQVVLRDPTLRETASTLVEESAIEVLGEVIASPQAPGGVELVANELTVLAASQQPPVELWRPMQQESLPHLLDTAAVSQRHLRRRAVTRLAAASVAGFRAALDRAQFTEIFTPKLVASATESGADVFAVDYFGRVAYLAQSPQFYKQTMVGALERVYEVGPVFRAEPHDTARHLATYVSLDAELAFVEDHRDVMAVLERTVAAMLETLQEREGESLHLLGLKLPVVPAQIPVVHFVDAQEMASVATGEDTRGEPDLSPATERWLGEWALREHGSDFVFVEGYPTAKRAFYTAPDPERPGCSRAFDLIFRGQELVSGSERLHRYDDYVTALRSRGTTDLTPYAGYLDVFRYGIPAHGGFAIGLERWMSRLTGAANIRDVTLFPRDLHRLTP